MSNGKAEMTQKSATDFYKSGPDFSLLQTSIWRKFKQYASRTLKRNKQTYPLGVCVLIGGEFTTKNSIFFVMKIEIKTQLTPTNSFQQSGWQMNMVRTLEILCFKLITNLGRQESNSKKGLEWSEPKSILGCFGCETHAHIPNARRTIENKSCMCVQHGMTDESNGYRLHCLILLCFSTFIFYFP